MNFFGFNQVTSPPTAMANLLKAYESEAESVTSILSSGSRSKWGSGRDEGQHDGGRKGKRTKKVTFNIYVETKLFRKGAPLLPRGSLDPPPEKEAGPRNAEGSIAPEGTDLGCFDFSLPRKLRREIIKCDYWMIKERLAEFLKFKWKDHQIGNLNFYEIEIINTSQKEI